MIAVEPEPMNSGQQVRTRRIWFRFLAALLGVAFFAVIELLCVITGLGSATIDDDPFVGFASVRPLFERDEDGVNYHTSPARRGFFKEDSFAVTKPEREFRIFVFGGSTVQGNPFSIETSFPAYLQVALEKADPGRSWKVVNCGGVSYASYRLLPVMQECCQYEPDLFIFCEGHNEFLEDVSYSSIRQNSAILQRAFTTLDHLRSFRALRNAFSSLTNSAATSKTARPLLPEEVDTLLDHDGGLAVYHRDDNHALAVVEHFRNNLRRMADLCELRRLPLLMILPPSSLTDCPPFKSEMSQTLSAEDQDRLQNLLTQARMIANRDVPKAIELVQQAVELDPRFAFAWYELGELQLTAGMSDNAERSLRRARDEDICPLRMTTPLENAFRETAAERSLPMIDAQQLLSSRCANGIVGGSVLVDHVHPSFRGHEDIAIAIAEWMISAGIATANQTGWQESTRTECQASLQALDDLYFLRGQRALKNLQLWAAGRSGGPPLSQKNRSSQ